MPPLAHPLAVPLQADEVLSPRLVYVHASPLRPDPDWGCDALYFRLPDRDAALEGRVTFEGLDAVRVCRGEHRPFEPAEQHQQGDWVHEISDSPWLSERHAYEVAHYRTPLIGRYHHYLFTFHDQFVEAIAEGIWLDKPDPLRPRDVPLDHPLAYLDETAAPEPRTSPTGLRWELRRSPKPDSVLMGGSELCSQRLYQFNLVLDAESSESASVWLRTVDGQTTSYLKRSWVGTVASRAGLAQPEDFFDVWEQHVAEVAHRRRVMGKPLA